MRRLYLVCALASVLVGAFHSAHGQSSADWALCETRDIRLTDQAIDACTSIISASDNDRQAQVRAYGHRGIVISRRALAEQSEKGKEKARRDLEAAVRLDSDGKSSAVFLGHLSVLKRDPKTAAFAFDEAIRRNPTDVLALASRGTFSAANRDYDAAIADYSEAIRLDPRYTSALVGRAQAYIGRREWDSAITDLDQALALDSNSLTAAAAYSTRGTVRYQLSNFTGAIVDCDAALRLKPRNAQAERIRSFAYAAQGKASTTGDARYLSQSLIVYRARGTSGICGEQCDEWIAAEGVVDSEGVRRMMAQLDRLGSRKLPVVLFLRGGYSIAARNIGKIFRERGIDVMVGETIVHACRDRTEQECDALKRGGGPFDASLEPIEACEGVCVVSLAGGVRRTVPDATVVIIDGAWISNRIGLRTSVEAFREGRHERVRDLIKVYIDQMGLDPQVADLIEANYDIPWGTELFREDAVRLRIVTP